MKPEVTPDTTTQTENAPKSLITVEILGFSKTPGGGVRLNTSPSITVYVNSVPEYENYSRMIGQKAEFIGRTIAGRGGIGSRKVYDLNLRTIGKDELEELFKRREFDDTATQEERPY